MMSLPSSSSVFSSIYRYSNSSAAENFVLLSLLSPYAWQDAIVKAQNRLRTPSKFWEPVCAIIDDNVNPEMSNDSWAEGFGFRGRFPVNQFWKMTCWMTKLHSISTTWQRKRRSTTSTSATQCTNVNQPPIDIFRMSHPMPSSQIMPHPCSPMEIVWMLRLGLQQMGWSRR